MNPYSYVGNLYFINDIIDIVCKITGTNKEMLYSKTKKRSIVETRLLILFIISKLTFVSNETLVRVTRFPIKRSNVSIQLKNINDKIKFDKSFNKIYNECINKLNELKITSSNFILL